MRREIISNQKIFQSNSKIFTSRRKTDSSNLTNCSIAIQNSSNEMPLHFWRNDGKFNNFTFTRNQAKFLKNSKKRNRPNIPSPNNTIISCPFLSNRLGWCNAISNKFSEFFILTDKTDLSSFSNIPIGYKQTYQIGEFRCPFNKKIKVYIPFLVGSPFEFISTGATAKRPWIPIQLPFGSINNFTTLKTFNHFPSSTIRSRQFSPIHSDSIICQKCGAVKCQLGLEKKLERQIYLLPNGNIFQVDGYIEHLLLITAELKRVLKPTGIFFLNHGDSYGGSSMGSWNAPIEIRGKQFRHCLSIDTEYLAPPRKDKSTKSKCLNLQNFRLLIRLIDEQGWICRNVNIWCLAGNMPIYARSMNRPLRTTIRELYRLPHKNLELPGVNGWRKVKNIKRFSKTHCLSIYLRNGLKIKCSLEHKFLTERGMLKAFQLKKGDMLRQYKIPEYNNGNMNYDIGWLVGLFLAEGSYEREDSVRFSLSSKEDDIAIRLFEIGKRFSAYPRKYKYGNNLVVVLGGFAITGLVKQYIDGKGSSKKHLSHRAWNENKSFLNGIMDGWLRGDGHYDRKNDRWRIGFTLNRELEEDMRVIACMLGLSYRSHSRFIKYQYGKKKSIIIDIKKKISPHNNTKSDGEIMRIENIKAIVYGIEVDGDNLFLLPDGTITHNSKPNAMPSSVTSRFANKWEPVFMLVKNSKPQYSYNVKTGVMADKKPKELKEGTDWEWKEGEEYIDDCQTTQYSKSHHDKKIKTGKSKKVSFWKSLDYWFDLDAIRIPQKYPEDVARRIRQDKEDGIMPFAKDNKNGIAWRRDQSFNYRVREAKKGHNGIMGVKATEEEMKRYDKNGQARGPEYEGKWKNNQEYMNKLQQRINDARASGIPHDEALNNPKGKNPGDVWIIPTQPFPEAHFATFPMRLVEPLIKAGCPMEICKKCGKARVRISKYETEFTRPGRYSKYDGQNLAASSESRKRRSILKNIQTIGWTDCHCNEGFHPGIVLDPFAGAGTTLIVAKKLGRSYIGIEIKSEYVEMSERRLAKTVYQKELNL